MNVYLLAHTPIPEKVVASAAKLCYSDSTAGDLMEGLTDESAAKYLRTLTEMGHESPVEHASFTFAIEGVSRSFLAQITRHRLASYSVQSQRYVRLDNFEYVTPPALTKDPDVLALYEETMKRDAEAYNAISDKLKARYTAEYVQQGLSEKAAASKAEKRAIEDARFVLPNACTTQMVVTMNVRSLRHLFMLRCCNRAQWEIHQVADEMLKLVYKVAPSLFESSGPSCVALGRCPEGKMTCGRFAEVQEYYRKLKEDAGNER
ncbi:MAG: FAD-dependent thymidylate synthase [Oscillospiraceae bacterium]|nr:FAD-dependent thymidylate synthase [Oscillospiraceae bacterium]